MKPKNSKQNIRGQKINKFDTPYVVTMNERNPRSIRPFLRQKQSNTRNGKKKENRKSFFTKKKEKDFKFLKNA